jgi:2-(1,2-epoxy-1,2-dihydrophenyl)acetyl-CoA isomerase
LSSAVLLDHHHDGVAFLTLNRPERANVLDLETSAALAAAIDALAADRSLRAVLLRARGRHFCAGGDIGDFVRSIDALGELLDTHIPALHRAIFRLATLPVPVVSALNGPIGGGGIGLALCADLVLAAESMKLRGGYSAIGLSPDAGSSWFLARRAGAAKAKEIFFTNEPLSARQCLQAGIVSQVLPDDALEAHAVALAISLARGASGSLARIKQLVDGAAERTLAEQLALEHRCMVECGRSADAVEGVTAFAEKRAPVFGREPR